MSLPQMDGCFIVNGVVAEVSSTFRPPRMAGDGCGCERSIRFIGTRRQFVITLCEKHGREPYIVTYMNG